MNDRSTVRCMICGLCRRDLNGHIRTHNLTSNEYKIRYPGAATISDETRQIKSQSIKGKKRRRPVLSDEQRNQRSQRMKERWTKLKETLGEEAYRAFKLDAAHQMRAAKGHNYRHSEETITKMRGPRPESRGRRLSDQHRFHISQSARNRPSRGPHSDETKAKMREAWLRRKHDIHQYKDYVDKARQRMTTPEAIERIRNNVAKRLANPSMAQKQYGTKIEIRMEEWLAQHNLIYVHQYHLSTSIGTFVYDFFVPSMNLLIEVDGEYWHSKSLEQINRDRLKIRKAKEAGLSCVRISDKHWYPAVIFSSVQKIDQHNLDLIEKRLRQYR